MPKKSFRNQQQDVSRSDRSAHPHIQCQAPAREKSRNRNANKNPTLANRSFAPLSPRPDNTLRHPLCSAGSDGLEGRLQILKSVAKEACVNDTCLKQVLLHSRVPCRVVASSVQDYSTESQGHRLKPRP